MAESVIKPADAGSLAPTQGKVQEMDITYQENAVGYREYLEAMGLEASDREVRRHLNQPHPVERQLMSGLG